jgi:hypothetical protein
MLGISFESVWSILKDSLNINQIADKFVPFLPSEEQKKNCVSMCQDFQEKLERDQELCVTSFFFPKLKIALQDRTFNDITMIQAKSQRTLRVSNSVLHKVLHTVV